MPSVSDPGYFCTNGMSESRHDSPFANSGLVVTIEPAETGSAHPLAGVHYQQRVERAAYLAGGRSYKSPIQWARDFLAGRQSRGKIPSSYRRGTLPIDLALLIPEAVMESMMIGAAAPPSASYATRKPGKARRWRGFTPAAREPATPGES
jgi:uncharacterized FAD-dependent dehydrogenase